MGERIHYEHGAFCWPGLATSDASVATRFYSRLFGWEAADLSAPSVGRFTLLRRAGKDAAILYRQTPEARAAGVAPHWTPFLSVEDADETAVRAETLGGGRIRGSFDVLDLGRVATLRDPAGTIVSLWQARAKHGIESRSEAGSLCWHELATSDPDAAMSFYGSLLGWQYDTRGDYITIEAAGKSSGGIRRSLDTEQGKVPRWLPYFCVESADEAADEARQAEGDIVVQPWDGSIGALAGRFALISDPLGAEFGVYEDGRAAA